MSSTSTPTKQPTSNSIKYHDRNMRHKKMKRSHAARRRLEMPKKRRRRLCEQSDLEILEDIMQLLSVSS